MTAFHVGGCACMALMAAALAATGSGRLTSPGLLSALSGCLRAITSCFHPAQPGFISPAPRRSQAPCRFVSSPGNARTGARATRTHPGRSSTSGGHSGVKTLWLWDTAATPRGAPAVPTGDDRRARRAPGCPQRRGSVRGVRGHHQERRHPPHTTRRHPPATAQPPRRLFPATTRRMRPGSRCSPTQKPSLPLWRPELT